MHLLGARSRYRYQAVPGAVVDNFYLVRITKSIMKAAERQTGYSIYRNSELLSGLVNHLGPSLRRLHEDGDSESLAFRYADALLKEHGMEEAICHFTGFFVWRCNIDFLPLLG